MTNLKGKLSRKIDKNAQKEPRFQGEKPGLRGDLAMYLTLGTIILLTTIQYFIHTLQNNFNML